MHRFIALLLAFIVVTPALARGQGPAQYSDLRDDAEKLVAEHSYAKAREIYLRAKTSAHPPSEERWIDFRLADTLWRSQAASPSADTTLLEAARAQLEGLIASVKRVEDRDRVWAESKESLADYWWVRRASRNWGAASPLYQEALDWWAGARDIELARSRYLSIVWRVAEPPQAEPYEYYGYYGNVLTMDVLENALRIATTEPDRARIHYYIAMTLERTGDESQIERVPDEFEAAISAGRSAAWYDDALYQYAQFLANSGRAVYSDDGNWTRQVDFPKALELYKRVVTEFHKGETRYYDEAVQAIDAITQPSVSVGVPSVFLPGSEVGYTLAWRNVSRIDLALYKLDLLKDTAFTKTKSDVNGWISEVQIAGRQPVRTWFRDTNDQADHKPGQEQLRIEGKALPMGAYLIEAKAGTATSRDLVLVTDSSIVVKTSSSQALAYVCNAGDGSPVSGARVALCEADYDSDTSTWTWKHSEATANKDGIAVIELAKDANYRQILLLASDGDRQAFSFGQQTYSPRSSQPWRIYAYTDRPAYRPGEEAQWKIVARQYADGAYSTPANQTVEYEIDDPRGSKVVDGTATLNEFGSAWANLQLTASMPLGEYQVRFWNAGRTTSIGSATLFRLEEYKLPEFKVSISTPVEDGKKKAFRLGEKVRVDIAADYYFGGSVANANVEVLVYQNPYYRYWHAPREYPWLYDDSNQGSRGYYNGGQVVKRDVLKTDVDGKAQLTFDTPRVAGQDFEYTIEARVTDASRREIVATDSVRVTRQRYYVDLQPDRTLLRPVDEAHVKLKALDANDDPIVATGTVKVTRDYWWEVWIDPKGKEVSGDELRKAREKSPTFPPTPRPGDRPWQLKFRGYQHADVSTQSVQTDAKGEADVRFTPAQEGYYTVAWSSKEAGAPPIVASATVWALTGTTTDLGYRSGGLEVVVDADTLRVGDTARVMVAAPSANRFVLFSVEGDDLYDYQLVRMTGSVKLIEFPVQEKHVPNVFLSATMVSDNQLFVDTKQVVVPPTRNFLNVSVESDRDVYQPQEEGTLKVVAKDSAGNPVRAEVGLGLVDDSVYYIQKDYAGDPRQVYFGDKRQQRVSALSSFQWKSYARLGAEAAKDRDAGIVSETVSIDGSRVMKESSAEFGQGTIGRLAAPASNAFERKKADNLPMNGRQVVSELSIQPGVVAGPENPVQVRSDFRSTVFWQPDVVTGDDGTAIVKVRYPDSLTSWRATARAATTGSQFGIASATSRTRKPLTVRLEAPRFFVAGDVVTLSAIVNNNTDAAVNVSTSIAVAGLDLKSSADAPSAQVSANGEKRFDWTAEAQIAGPVKLEVTAHAGSYADAMQRSFVVYEHGVDKLVAVSGKARSDDTVVDVELPAARKQGTTRLDVQVSPSIAATMLDAIPYLIDYPYGCTEQTMSRFLPAAVVSKTLTDLGIRAEDVEGRMFGGIESATAAQTHPGGKRDVGELGKVERASLDRLYDFQHDDGGWGWWKTDASDHYMTAYVIWGLTLAKRAGVEVKSDVLEKAANYLNGELVEEEANYDVQAWMLHALAVYHGGEDEPAGLEELAAFDNIYTHRDLLAAYTRALLALAAHDYKLEDQTQVLVRNLANGAKIDRAPATSVLVPPTPPAPGAPVAAPAPPPEVIATAHWGEDTGWWRWSDGSIEATSFSLSALVTIDPQNELIEPAMNWLVKNRRGAQWTNTRDTSYAILALDDYLRQTKELGADLSYEVLVNGSSVATRTVAAGEAIASPAHVEVDPQLVRDGANEVRIVRRGGTGAIYFAAEARFFSTEEPVTAAGSGLFVRRQYFRLTGRPTLLKGYVYDRVPLGDGDEIRSGDRVQTVLTVETKNDYEYLLFEDLKPAGFEAVEIRSGESTYAKELKSGAVAGDRSGDAADYTDRTEWVYSELRDRNVALFVGRLPQGIWEIRYDMRAEAPGVFHALPVVGQAMYVPEIRGNSAEQRVRVAESE